MCAHFLRLGQFCGFSTSCGPSQSILLASSCLLPSSTCGMESVLEASGWDILSEPESVLVIVWTGLGDNDRDGCIVEVCSVQVVFRKGRRGTECCVALWKSAYATNDRTGALLMLFKFKSVEKNRKLLEGHRGTSTEIGAPAVVANLTAAPRSGPLVLRHHVITPYNLMAESD